MHSKVLICDDKITSIGSANMDRRSFSINFEINTFIYDREFNLKNRELVENDIENSEYLNDTIKKKNKFGLWLERIFRLFAPMM
jgi:cardiolipin synthase